MNEDSEQDSTTTIEVGDSFKPKPPAAPAPEPEPARPIKTIRPTKKQSELLDFIDAFIGEHGYSPSYREIMNGLNYNSVATVALHVNNLIARGHLRKRDRSARSLEVVKDANSDIVAGPSSDQAPTARQEKWLVEKVDSYLNELESTPTPEEQKVDDVYVLIGALHVLGLDDAVRSFVPRLNKLKGEE